MIYFYLKINEGYWNLAFQHYCDNIIKYFNKFGKISLINNLNIIKSNDIIICYTKNLYD